MKRHFLLAALVFGSAALSLRAADAPEKKVLQVAHDQVAASFGNGKALVQEGRYKVLASKRVTVGVVEVHEKETDIFYVLEGAATLLTGGTVEGGKPTGPGEIRGHNLVGGTEHRLAKGDIFVVPSGIPHWFKEVNGTFLSIVVKVAD